MRRAIYPGSFDPVTNGHLDVIERARKLFDEVIVAVAYNDQKQPMFTLEERLGLLRASIGEADHVQVASFEGLLVDFAVKQKATAVIRGLRAISDFEFEFQMALMNRKLEAAVETIFLMPKEEYTYLSSRIVKEIARLGGDITSFVPTPVVEAIGREASIMKIHLRQIPNEGLHLEGDEECPLPELERDGIVCAGPLHYSLDLGISEGSLWANGRLSQPIELSCVSCLQRFVHTVEVPEFAILTELTGPETVDLKPFMREDILLNIPAYPHCDKQGGKVCQAPQLKAVEDPADEGKRKPDWSALDKLEL